MTTLFAFILVLGVLVFVHELGHYLMAKRLGIRVITFSLGFGPKIVSFKRGDTDYCISAIPLGGYVKMAGENPDDPRTGRDDEFLSKSKRQRFQVLLMGPTMNILLAIVLMAVVLMQGAQVPAFQDEPVNIGAIAAGSAAEHAGIRPGDRIIEVAGRHVSTWEEFFIVLGTRAKRALPITLLRTGREMTVEVTPPSDGRTEVGDIGVLPDVHPVIQNVEKSGPADRAGFQPGDVVWAFNGQTVTFSKQLSDLIRKNPEAPVSITVHRKALAVNLSVTPEKRGSVGVIGVGIQDALKTIQPGPIQAIGMSFQKNFQFAGLIVETLWGLITRETSPRQLMGPVGIAQVSGRALEEGWITLLTWMASISLNLGLVNLLPIPVLDGGHIFIMAVEGVARRDFSMKVKEKMLIAGFVLLLMVMITVIYNDLTRIPWIEGLMPWRR